MAKGVEDRLREFVLEAESKKSGREDQHSGYQDYELDRMHEIELRGYVDLLSLFYSYFPELKDSSD